MSTTRLHYFCRFSPIGSPLCTTAKSIKNLCTVFQGPIDHGFPDHGFENPIINRLINGIERLINKQNISTHNLSVSFLHFWDHSYGKYV